MAIRNAEPPRAGLYRIGRTPDPLQFKPKKAAGGGRFDDPRGIRCEFVVLYAAAQRIACFIETLAPYRRDLTGLAHALTSLSDSEHGDDVPARTALPEDWHKSRMIGRFRLASGQDWLDLRSHETREAFRTIFASLLLNLGLQDFDLSVALGSQRPLTQAIARWAFEQGYRGIAYTSRFGSEYDCWAIFNTAAFTRGVASTIVPDDKDFVKARQVLGLP